LTLDIDCLGFLKMSRGSPGSAEWFLVAKGKKLGPLSREKLGEIACQGGLDPRLDMVWREGMGDWMPAGLVEGLFERRVPEPESEEEDFFFHHELTGPWPGVGRVGFFLGAVVMPVVAYFLLPLFVDVVESRAGVGISQYVPFLYVGLVVLVLHAIMMRFSNLGMRRWWLFGLLIPGLDCWLGFRLFACPTGYALTKRLGKAGWALAVPYWLGVVVGVAGLAMFVFGDEMPKPEIANRNVWIDRIP
jgi:hypothetical protein